MSFSTNWADVVKIDASLHCVATTIQADILSDVDDQLNENYLGAKRYALACKRLAAHLATLYLQGDAQVVSGPVTSESVGSVSRSYAPITGVKLTDAFFMSTKHGAEYLRLIKTSAARFFVL